MYTRLRLAHIVAADNPRKATDVKITTFWRQNDGKRGKARFADGWERPSATTRRQGTNGCGRERSLATKIGRCLGGEWRCLDGARQQGTRSDGWQRIGWRQGTAADGGLRRRWRDRGTFSFYMNFKIASCRTVYWNRTDVKKRKKSYKKCKIVDHRFKFVTHRRPPLQCRRYSQTTRHQQSSPVTLRTKFASHCRTKVVTISLLAAMCRQGSICDVTCRCFVVNGRWQRLPTKLWRPQND